MKFNLLGAVSTLALGVAFGLGAPTGAEAVPALNCTGNALAGTCTTSGSISVNQGDFSNTPIALDYFVAPFAGDALTAVTVTMNGSISATGSLTNGSSTQSATGGYSFTHANMTFAGGTPSNFLSPTVTSINSAATTSITLAANASQAFSLSKQVGPKTQNDFTGGFTGTGVFDALVTSKTTGGAFATPAVFSATASTNATATVTVVYTYAQATPEPASLALLGVGLAGVGAIRRRRKA
jgi:PEP-CTERM motif